MVAAIRDRTGTEIEVVDAFRRVEIDEREFNPNFLRDVSAQAGVAIGLALRRAGDR